MTRPKPRRNLTPIIVVTAVVVVLGAGGGWLLLPHKSEGSDLGLPEGVASMGDVERCLRERDKPCAEADLLAYLDKYPNDAHATALLAITLTQDGRHKEALTYYVKADRMGVATYDFYGDYAKSLEATGDLDKAIVENQAALKIVPGLVDVRGALAQELVTKGRPQEALDLLQSFDRQLESDGYSAYFTAQIQRIETGMKGGDARGSAQNLAAAVEKTPGQITVSGQPSHGTLEVPVSIAGAQPENFTVDSGASLVSIPYADALPLLKLGRIRSSDYRGQGQFRLANGTMVTAQIYSLRSVKVGDADAQDVLAAVYRGHGPRLLGQSFLKRFKSWSLDNGRRALVLTN